MSVLELIPRLTYSSPHYYHVRDVLPKQVFQPLGSAPVMRHSFTGDEAAGLRGTLYLLPEVGYERGSSHRATERERLERETEKRRSGLSDLDADVLDILFGYWLKRSEGQDDYVWIDTDEILHARGLNHKVNGSGSNEDAIGRGYTPTQRASANWALHRIASVELKIEDLPGHDKDDTGTSPVLEVAQPRSNGPAPGHMSPSVWLAKGNERSEKDLDDPDFEARRNVRYRPGGLFRRYSRDLRMYQPPEIYSYRPNQSWEKRLGRYFSWQWRINRKESVPMHRSVRSLLNPVVLDVNARRLGLNQSGQDSKPREKNFNSRVRRRFELALNRLSEDDVAIGSWEYCSSWSSDWSKRSNWQSLWLDSEVRVTPSSEMTDAHEFEVDGSDRGIGPKVKQAREQEGLAQTETVEWMYDREGVDITRESLSRIERQKDNPSQETRKALKAFLRKFAEE